MSSGRKGRSKPGRIKKGSNALGRALVRDKKKKHTSHRAKARLRNNLMLGTRRTGSAKDNKDLKSVFETNDLDAFISNAQMSGRTFTAERESATIVGENGFVEPDAKELANASGPMDARGLQIPRRPKWSKDMTPEELSERERESFLEWRRKIAMMTEKEEEKENAFAVTPFEKNLEVWRQLWRVLERSDIVFQIVDSRNIDLYRSRDLEQYAKSISPHKRYVLLLNKADFMSERLRTQWARFLNREGIEFVFFSAKTSQQVIDAEKSGKSAMEKAHDDERSDNGGGQNEDVASSKTEILTPQPSSYINTSRVLTREELLCLMQWMHSTSSSTHHRELSVFGMVGFPNVGKSSLINVLMEVSANEHTSKRVAVGATPGKTKHFQTLILNDTITLCDCPGLVFPVFMRGKADMIVNGILPIDQMREYMAPVALVCRRIPRQAFSLAYGLHDLRPRPDAPEYTTAKCLLTKYSLQKGYLRANGSGPDMARSSRYILKDYASGRLLFCFPPQRHASDDDDDDDDVTKTTSSDRSKPVVLRTAEGGETYLSTTEAVIAEEDSAFDVDLLDTLRFDDVRDDAVNGVGDDKRSVPKQEYMVRSSNAMLRRRAGKKGAGKGKGRRGRHGRDLKPYEDMGHLIDMSFVREDHEGERSRSHKRKNRRKRGERKTKHESQKHGVTMRKPF